MRLPQVCVAYLLRQGDSETGPEVLLGRKLRGLGVGKMVGLGGKLQPGEHPRHAAVREIGEESGVFVDPDQLTPVGQLRYLFPSHPALSQESWVYTCREWIGEPAPSDELVPEWFPVDEIPYARMWSDARIWLPRALAGYPVRSTYVFGEDLHTAIASDDPASGLPEPGSL